MIFCNKLDACIWLSNTLEEMGLNNACVAGTDRTQVTLYIITHWSERQKALFKTFLFLESTVDGNSAVTLESGCILLMNLFEFRHFWNTKISWSDNLIPYHLVPS